MRKNLGPKLNYSNVIASIALFVALGGAAVAAGLPKHSVGPKQLKRGAVHPSALAKRAVTSGKLAPKSVVAGKLGPNAVLPGNLGNGIISTAKLAGGAVATGSIKNGAVNAAKLAAEAVVTAKLQNGAVTTSKLDNGAVTAAKLGPEIAPLLGTLRSGQTLRGVFDLGGSTTVARQGVSFQFPLANVPAAPETNVLAADASTAACPGLKGGNLQTPEAAPGQLCVYVKTQSAETESLVFDAGSVSRLGFGLRAQFSEPKEDNLVQGFWAVTAP